jgi:phosphoenolpyruvate carboxykinase (ATP)
MIDAIHNGDFQGVEYKEDAEFGFEIPTACPGVPDSVLIPENTWEDKKAYTATKSKLIALFKKNFEQFEAGVNAEIIAAGPK